MLVRRMLNGFWCCRVVLLLGAGLCGLLACDADAGIPHAVRTDSAGVEIVLSDRSDRRLEGEFRRLFALGGADEGPESFFRVAPGLIGADATGNLFVLDPPNARVLVFDADGRFLRSMGSRGGGPGQFRSPGTISVSPEGDVAVFDYGKGSLVRFDARGEAQVERAFPLFPTPNTQRHFHHVGDTVLVSTSTSPMAAGPLTQMLRQIVDSDTLLVATLPLPPVAMTRFEQCGVGLPLQPIFAPELVWAAHGGIVAVGSSVEYSVSIAEGGRVTFIVRRGIEPTPATREHAIRHLGDTFRVNVRGQPCDIDPADVVERGGYAETIPLIAGLFWSPSGELWVRRYAVGPDTTAPIDVFDPRGEYVGTLVRDGLSPVILLPEGRVGVVETDDFEVQRLVVFAIHR